jgi:hypothetical protein
MGIKNPRRAFRYVRCEKDLFLPWRGLNELVGDQ